MVDAAGGMGMVGTPFSMGVEIPEDADAQCAPLRCGVGKLGGYVDDRRSRKNGSGGGRSRDDACGVAMLRFL